MIRKTLSTITLFLGCTELLLAQEPQGGTLIQMSSIGLALALLAAVSFKGNKGNSRKKYLTWLKTPHR